MFQNICNAISALQGNNRRMKSCTIGKFNHLVAQQYGEMTTMYFNIYKDKSIYILVVLLFLTLSSVKQLVLSTYTKFLKFRARRVVLVSVIALLLIMRTSLLATQLKQRLKNCTAIQKPIDGDIIVIKRNSKSRSHALLRRYDNKKTAN